MNFIEFEFFFYTTAQSLSTGLLTSEQANSQNVIYAPYSGAVSTSKSVTFYKINQKSEISTRIILTVLSEINFLNNTVY